VTRALQRTQSSLLSLVRALLNGDSFAAREHREAAARIIVADATPRRSRRPPRAIDFLQRQHSPIMSPRSRRPASQRATYETRATM